MNATSGKLPPAMRLPDFPPLSIIKNRLVPGHWDVLAFLLVIVFFIYLAEAAQGLVQPLARLEAVPTATAPGFPPLRRGHVRVPVS